MKLPIEYRSYIIDHEDGWYVAKPIDGEPCEIGSRRLFRVMRAIDALWEALESGEAPTWLIASGSVDLDQPVKDRLRLFLPFWKPLNRFSSAPSQVDPPSTWKTAIMISGAVALATPIAIAAQHHIKGLEPEIIFTLIVMAVALGRGTGYALIVSVFSAFVFHYFCQHPTFQFGVPGLDDFTYLAINVALSVVLPWLFAPRHKVVTPSGRRASGRIRDTA